MNGVPSLIKEKVPHYLYAHTSEIIDFERLKGNNVAFWVEVLSIG
ncbi:MAG: hypothetical protein ACQEWV_23990 [Bacillota bacterium]